MTVRFGMLGYAHVHAPGFARIASRLSGASLLAVAEADATLRATVKETVDVETLADPADLLARRDIDAVIVMSATADHLALIEAAAVAGKHVLCEKPIATTFADGVAIVDACKRHGVKLQTAFPMRYSPASAALRRVVRSGELGDPLMVKATNIGTYPGGWFGDPVLAGGGAVMDHVVHVADMLRWIFAAEITEVYAEIDTRLHQGLAVDDVAILTMSLDNGVTATLDPSWARPAAWPTWGGLTLDVIGSEQVASLDAFRENIELFASRGDARTYHLLPWGIDSNTGLLQSFVDAIAGDTTPPITGEDGLAATAVALAAYESARRAEPVAVPG
jgi:predicted dehydrogenase